MKKILWAYSNIDKHMPEGGAFGLPKLKDHKKKLSNKKKGKLNPQYGKRGEETPFYGKYHTEESKKKMKGKNIKFKKRERYEQKNNNRKCKYGFRLNYNRRTQKKMC